MSDGLRVAFGSLEERAKAVSGGKYTDRISLRNYTLDVEIGAFQSERDNVQRLCFNVVVEVAPANEPLHDDVDRILSYDTITDAIRVELGDERLNLLETLADRVAARILKEPGADRVFIRIEKLDRGPGALGVEIVRDKQVDSHEARGIALGKDVRPLVVYLSNRAVSSGRLSDWVDQIISSGRPAVFCVGAGDLPISQASGAFQQRRIELLAFEQNAWVLAGNDQRIEVLHSRTELDWAIRNDQISVWAPSKIVLDSPPNIATTGISAIQLANWFSHLLNAERLIVVGETLPVTGEIAATVFDDQQEDILTDIENSFEKQRDKND